MESELAALEGKMLQVLELCRRLRDENRQLRQQLADAESDRKQLSEKIDDARDRLQGLLQRIPE